MPCTRRPIRTRILPPSHLDCNVKGAALFSPFASPNKSRWTLQVLKGLSWHQVGFGVPPKVFTPVFTCGVLKKFIQPSTWQLVSRSTVSLFHFTWPLPTDKIKGLWGPKKLPIQQKKSWMWIIHNAQTAALFVWALSFCKVRIETALNLNGFRVYGVNQVFAADTEPLHTCDETSPIDTFPALLLWLHPARTIYSTYWWVLEPSSRRSEL